VFLLELMCYLHHLLRSLPWCPDVTEVVVMVAAVILEDVAQLEEGVVLIVVDRLLVIKGTCNVSIMGVITTSLRSVGRV